MQSWVDGWMDGSVSLCVQTDRACGRLMAGSSMQALDHDSGCGRFSSIGS